MRGLPADRSRVGNVQWPRQRDSSCVTTAREEMIANPPRPARHRRSSMTGRAGSAALRIVADATPVSRFGSRSSASRPPLAVSPRQSRWVKGCAWCGSYWSPLPAPARAPKAR
jgi:hypothetical protein